MLNMFIKKQVKTSIFIVLVFCLIYLLYNEINSNFAERYSSIQDSYMQTINSENRAEFFDFLDSDLQQARKLVSTIENYESYDGEVIFKEIDPLLAAANANNYATYDMIIWKEEMLDMPGKWCETIEDDYYMLVQLSDQLNNQRNFDENLSNNIELMSRGMRRNDSDFKKYELVNIELNKINTTFSYANTLTTNRILDYIEKDCFIIILLALTYFSVFSNAVQNKITQQIIISARGMRKYAVEQYLAVIILTSVSFILYYLCIIFVLGKGNLFDLHWQMPIQTINGYENISYAFTVGDYFARALFIKFLHSLFIVSIFTFVSIVSRNNTIAAILCSVLCGIIFIPTALSTGENMFLNTLLLGESKYLFSDLPFVSIGGNLFPLSLCFISTIILSSAIIFGTIVYLSKIIVKRRYNK